MHRSVIVNRMSCIQAAGGVAPASAAMSQSGAAPAEQPLGGQLLQAEERQTQVVEQQSGAATAQTPAAAIAAGSAPPGDSNAVAAASGAAQQPDGSQAAAGAAAGAAGTHAAPGRGGSSRPAPRLIRPARPSEREGRQRAKIAQLVKIIHYLWSAFGTESHINFVKDERRDGEDHLAVEELATPGLRLLSEHQGGVLHAAALEVERVRNACVINRANGIFDQPAAVLNRAPEAGAADLAQLLGPQPEAAPTVGRVSWRSRAAGAAVVARRRCMDHAAAHAGRPCTESLCCRCCSRVGGQHEPRHAAPRTQCQRGVHAGLARARARCRAARPRGSGCPAPGNGGACSGTGGCTASRSARRASGLWGSCRSGGATGAGAATSTGRDAATSTNAACLQQRWWRQRWGGPI